MSARHDGRDDDRPVTIGSSSRMTIGLIVTLIGMAGGGFVSFQSLRDEVRAIGQTAHDEQTRSSTALRDEIREVADAVRDIRHDIASRTEDRWRRSEMRAWALTMKAQNPTLNVPEVP